MKTNGIYRNISKKSAGRTIIFIRTLILTSFLALMLTGCERDSEKIDNENTKISEDTAADSEKNSKDSENTGSASEKDNKDAKTDELAKASLDIYERFLNNHEPIYFDKWNLDGEWLDDEECYGNRFLTDTPYRFEELIDSFIQYMDVDESLDFRMGRVEYAYIDCGADKIPELALRIADYKTTVGVFSEIYVIKLIDNKLQLCYAPDYGYRMDASINEYGYIVIDDIMEDESYIRTEVFINADGEPVFLYDMSNKEKQNIPDTIINEKEPEWTVIEEAPEEEPGPVTVINPGWEYYCDDSLKEASSHIKLEKVSQKSNGIIDEDDWFYSLGINMPRRDYQSYNDYYFYMYGDDELGYYHNMLEISDMDGNIIVDLDFTEFYTPDSYYPSDAMFVSEAIYSPKIVNGILYISAFHKTYASSAPHNGYIMAVDMNDNYKVLWKTEPLTCNASNFEIVGDTIICGYGFTNEDDFIYLLDKNTGKRINTIKVKTGPEYFYAEEDMLYVRTYDTDYEFKIIYP